jgi:ABC-2 type transport system permease protein
VSARLYAHALGVQARKSMSYRADFWTNAVVTFFVEMALAYFLWTAIFRESGRAEIAGFSLGGMVVYYVAALLLGKIVKGNERDRSVADDIYEGGLTRYLLYPSSYFGFKYAEHLGSLLPAFVELAVFGALALVALPVPPDVHVTPQSVAMAAVSVAVSNALHFTLMFPLRAVAFWADNVWTLDVMYRFASQMLGGLMLPLALFPDWAQPALDVLPFKYLYAFPATTLLGQVPPAAWARGLAVSLAWCAVAGLVCRAVWRRGTLQYSGVGI